MLKFSDVEMGDVLISSKSVITGACSTVIHLKDIGQLFIVLLISTIATSV